MEEQNEGRFQPIAEEEEEEEVEEERVDFVKGIRCTDVETAIQILKTRYRLSNPTVRKFIITFSTWDVSQISHPISNRCSWWDETLSYPQENEEIGDLTEEIYTRQGEISDLVDRIMEEEKLKHDLAIKLAKQADLDKQTEDEPVIQPDEAITVENAPETTSPPDHTDNTDSGANKKKSRNALQRFIHAVSKKFRGNKHRADKDRAKA